jgi:hypothetical protein
MASSDVGTGFGAVYIGPVNVKVAHASIQKLITDVARADGYDSTYWWGMGYTKTAVMLQRGGVLEETKDEEGNTLKANDPQRQRLLYLFKDPRVLYKLLGKDEKGGDIKTTTIDTSYIQTVPDESVTVDNVLGFPAGSMVLAPYNWADTEDQQAKEIVITKEPMRIAIPLTDEERNMRSLANDNDRFGNTFHTSFWKSPWYPLASDKDKHVVRVKSAYTGPIVQGEPAPPALDAAAILRHFSYFDPHVKQIGKRDGDNLMFEFSNQVGAPYAVNLKGPNINVSSVNAQHNTSTRGSRGGASTSHHGGRGGASSSHHGGSSHRGTSTSHRGGSSSRGSHSIRPSSSAPRTDAEGWRTK